MFLFMFMTLVSLLRQKEIQCYNHLIPSFPVVSLIWLCLWAFVGFFDCSLLPGPRYFQEEKPLKLKGFDTAETRVIPSLFSAGLEQF